MGKIKKIALLTGGGDCPGLNAAIRAITRTAILKYNLEVIGYTYGFLGLYKNDYKKLDIKSVSGILHTGGSILYTSNHDNLFEFEVEENGVMVKKDVSSIAIENLKKDQVDALIVIGGDGTLKAASKYKESQINIVGVPKTINNDIPETDLTFGYNSALHVAVQALDRLHTTAESHHRIMVLEVMGRKAGWIALESGIAGSADVILIPEIPYDINKVVEKIEERKKNGKLFTIIVAAEGAISKEDIGKTIPIGGVGYRIASQLEKLLYGQEIRCTVLGYTQRGGNASTYDRILATRFGVRAVELVDEEKFGYVVCLKDGEITEEKFEKVVNGNKVVKKTDELVNVAKSIGIILGE